MPRAQPGERRLTRIEVTPNRIQLRPEDQRSIHVTAHYSDGSKRNVSDLTAFHSIQTALASVDRDGLIKAGPITGEAVVMARYMNFISTCRVTIPVAGEVPDRVYANLPRQNLIDRYVWDKLRALGLTPSETVDDARFLRRVHLDVIGRLPTPTEVRSFLLDEDTGKRRNLIDRLLQRREYADHWANKWVDLLRPNPYRVGIKAVFNYDHWIRDSFRQNKPYDQFVRELITAQGSMACRQ